MYLTLSNNMVLMILQTGLVKLPKITLEKMDIMKNFMLIIMTNIILCSVDYSKKLASVRDQVCVLQSWLNSY